MSFLFFILTGPKAQVKAHLTLTARSGPTALSSLKLGQAGQPYISRRPTSNVQAQHQLSHAKTHPQGPTWMAFLLLLALSCEAFYTSPSFLAFLLTSEPAHTYNLSPRAPTR